MYGTNTNGGEYEIEVTRGVTFRAYGVADSDRLEVSVEDGVIAVRLPDELCQWEARALAALLMEAADELERQEWLGGGE